MLEEVHRVPGNAFAEALERYLGETLHDHIRVGVLKDTIRLPTFLDRTYSFYESLIVGRRCIFLATEESVATPFNIAKHVALVRSVMDVIVVFAAPSLSAHNRSRLIGQGIAFVVPGNQLYIPDLAMDLREHFRAPKWRHADGLSPAAQAVLFHHLMRLDEQAHTPSLIAKNLRYSAMSIGRAFDDLVATGLAETERLGRERHLRFAVDRRDLLEATRNLLRSPVRTVKFIRDGRIGPPLKQAGEAALAELTEISRPRIATYAVAASDWKAVAEACGLVEAEEHDADHVVETWSYDPAGLSDAPVVDPLSLYAQFRDHRDERIAMAAERLLENLPW